MNALFFANFPVLLKGQMDQSLPLIGNSWLTTTPPSWLCFWIWNYSNQISEMMVGGYFWILTSCSVQTSFLRGNWFFNVIFLSKITTAIIPTLPFSTKDQPRADFWGFRPLVYQCSDTANIKLQVMCIYFILFFPSSFFFFVSPSQSSGTSWLYSSGYFPRITQPERGVHLHEVKAFRGSYGPSPGLCGPVSFQVSHHMNYRY